MLPHVILHTAVSVDGRIDWFSPNVGLFYELTARWNEDATLAGADTLLQAGDAVPPEDETAFQPPAHDPHDTRPLLVVPDSRGRVRHWHALRAWPYWRGLVALVSRSTSEEYVDYLRRRHVDVIVAGDDHIDLREALEELSARHGVRTVRVDSGGTLNGALLRAGLVDEVSVLVHPSMVGGMTPRSLFRAPDLTSAEGVIPLRLTHVEKLDGDVVWLRYVVAKAV